MRWILSQIVLYFILLLGVLPRNVYTATLFTTLSSTGIVCLLLIWIICRFTTDNKCEGFLLLTLQICVISLLYFRLDFFYDNTRFNLVEKIQRFFNKNSRDYVTVTMRVNLIEYWIYFCKNHCVELDVVLICWKQW